MSLSPISLPHTLCGSLHCLYFEHNPVRHDGQRQLLEQRVRRPRLQKELSITPEIFKLSHLMEPWEGASETEERRQTRRKVGQSVARVAVKIRQSVEDGRCLDLSDCKLICIPDAVFKMMRAVCARVQIARLSCNELPSLSVRFINTFSKLQELVLQGNQLQRLPDEVACMPCLIYIDLSRNKFQEFPEVVTQSASLQKICLQENSIREVSLQKLAAMKSLQCLDLRLNPVVSLEPGEISHLTFELLYSPIETNVQGTT